MGNHHSGNLESVHAHAFCLHTNPADQPPVNEHSQLMDETHTNSNNDCIARDLKKSSTQLSALMVCS